MLEMCGTVQFYSSLLHRGRADDVTSISVLLDLSSELRAASRLPWDLWWQIFELVFGGKIRPLLAPKFENQKHKLGSLFYREAFMSEVYSPHATR